MKTDKKTWRKKVQNLMDRRAAGTTDNRQCEDIVADYGRHLRSFQLGNSVLDVGCGGMTIAQKLTERHPHVKYVGIDPHPLNENVIKMEIEDPNQTADLLQQFGQFDNVLCFAVLDSCYDLHKATENMKKLAKQSVVFLTGIDIEPDQFHTFKITKELLDGLMVTEGWEIRMSNFLTPKVLLIEYARK